MWSRLEKLGPWVKFIDRRGVLAHYILERHEHAPLDFGDSKGAIFGPLFRRTEDRAGRVQCLDRDVIAELVDGGGGALITGYWGAWTAIINDCGYDLLHVVRDPCGAGPIYDGGTDQVRITCTHPGDYVRMLDGCEPDFDVLAASIVCPSLVTPRTAIVGLREIFPGERVTFPREGGVTRRELLWRPTTQSPQVSLDGFEAAAGELRRTLTHCAASWSDQAPIIVHRLSGGLDSSVVLAALLDGNATEIVAVNEFSAEAPEGDERAIARKAALKFGVRLVEIEMSPTRVDWGRLSSVDLTARPLRQIFSVADTTVGDAIATIHGGAVVTSGQGGDQVFHRSHLPYMAADAWRDGLDWQTVLRVAIDTARLGRRHVWSVLGTVVKHGLFRRPLPADGAAARVMLFDGGRGADAARRLDVDHPWAREIQSAPPARALRMGLIADLQNYRQRDAIALRFNKAQIVSSQPVIEFCLRTPPYVMTKGGKDRALLRTAFERDLPGEVLNRTSKGATTRYHAAVAHKHFSMMRDLLVGGEAEKLGLLNGRALREVFAVGEITSAPQSAALLSCLLVELWLRQFKATCETGSLLDEALQGEVAR